MNLKILGEDLFINFQAVNENGYGSCNNSDKDDGKVSEILLLMILFKGIISMTVTDSIK